MQRGHGQKAKVEERGEDPRRRRPRPDGEQERGTNDSTNDSEMLMDLRNQ